MSTNPFDTDDVDSGNVVGSSGGDLNQGYPSSKFMTSTQNNSNNNNIDDADLPVEASWQFLGDLPYRKVTLFSDVQWNEKIRPDSNNNNNKTKYRNNPKKNSSSCSFGLSSFPSFLNDSQTSTNLAQNINSYTGMKELLSTTTVTKVAGCPNGGPVAAITIPLSSSSSLSMNSSSQQVTLKTTELRIMMPSGRPLSTIEFPPPDLMTQLSTLSRVKKSYSASDILSIGFTDRTVLYVIFRDSLCLTYNLKGAQILPPFFILPSQNNKNQQVVELIEASSFDGGVAVLSDAMQSAIVEFFDEHDEPSYIHSCHFSARKIVPEGFSSDSGDNNESIMFGGPISSFNIPPHFAIVTVLPSDSHARNNGYYYCTIAVLPRIHTSSCHPEIFLSTSDKSVLILDSSTLSITDVDCREQMPAPIQLMSFAPNGRFLACFAGSVVTVISTSFDTKVLDFETSDESSSPPREMKWCGEDSVVLYWKHLGVLLVGPYGDWLRFPYDDPNVMNIHILSEVDCCRIITDNSVEIIQRVPPDTASLFRIGSIEPSAMLLDASDAFESGSPASDEAARAITRTGLLEDAIETCVLAATGEFDIPTQKRLLKAASYGMHFSYKEISEGDNSGLSQERQSALMGGKIKWDYSLGAHNTEVPEEEEDNSEQQELYLDSTLNKGNSAKIRPTSVALTFVAASKKLRILNALRDPRVGFSITSSQFDVMSPTGIIARLVQVKRPSVATSISQYLSLDSSVCGYARACRAVAFINSLEATKSTMSDTQVAEKVIQILNDDDNGSSSKEDVEDNKKMNFWNRGAYAKVALSAKRAGWSEVAKLLLRIEMSVPDKVQGLISIGAYDGATAVAQESRDSDLMFYSLLQFENMSMSSNTDPAVGQHLFFATLNNKCPKEVNNLMRLFYSSMGDVKATMAVNLRAQNHLDAGTFMARHALSQATERDRLSMMKEANRVFGLGKDTLFQKNSTDDYLELLFEQERLRSTLGQSVIPETSSITETIVAILYFINKCNPQNANKVVLEADRIAKKFRVPDKRLWHIKVKAFAESEQWGQLRILADSKKAPIIGYSPFAKAAIKGKQPIAEIMRYIEKVTSYEERYELFCEAKLWKRALDEATNKLKDPSKIMFIYTMCNSPEIQQLCENAHAQLS